MLEVKNLTFQVGDRKIIDNISFEVPENEWLMIIGPNGAGKSTIVNAISQSSQYTGDVLYQGVNLKSIKPTELAKKIGILMQHNYISYSFSIEEIVKLGRYSYSPGIFHKLTDESEEKVEEALKLTDLYNIKEQSVLTLSGGELQRTFLAQLLAQDPEMIILDEPTNHLDLVFQKQVFEIIEKWIKQPGRSVISVVHDLNLAKKYGTKALLMNSGHIMSQGTIEQVMTKENLEKAYSIDVYGWMNEMYKNWQ